MKNNYRFKFCAAIALSLGVFSGVRADVESPARISVDAGAAFPTTVNDYSQSAKTGFVVGAQYLRPLTDRWGIGVQGNYYHFGAKDRTVTNADSSQLDQRSTDNVGTVEMMGRYTFLPDSMFAPYVDAGIGVNYFHQESEGEPVDGAGWTDTGTRETRQLQDDGTLGLATSIGLGVETHLTDRLILGLESAWHLFSVSKSTYGTSFINVPTVSLRLGWSFGAGNEPSSSQD